MGKYSFNPIRNRNARKDSNINSGTPVDTGQPSPTGTSASQPINLVASEDSNSPRPEEFVDEEQGSVRSSDPPGQSRLANHRDATHMSPSHSFHTRSSQAESRPTTSPGGFDPSSGQVASEEQVHAMIQNIAQLAKQENQDKRTSTPVSSTSQHRRESSRRSLTRESSRRTSHQEPAGRSRRSSSHRRSSSTSHRHHDRPSYSRSRSRRESSSGDRREKSTSSHHHRRRSSSDRDGDPDRRRRRSSHHRRSKSRDQKKSNTLEMIVDEIPKQDLEKNTKAKRKNYGIFVFLLMLLVIPAMVALYFFLFAPQKTETDPLLPPSPIVPTLSPTQGPTIETPNPTLAPTELGATPNPTKSPSMTPTSSPTNNLEDLIRPFLLDNNIDVSSLNENDPVVKAANWLIDEAYFAKELVFPLNEKYLQRFGILVTYYSIFAQLPAGDNIIGGEEDAVADIQSEYFRNPRLGEILLPNWGMRTQDECFWKGMTCDDNGMLVEIKMPDQELVGTLPKELGLFPKLKVIDFSKNKLEGSIPEELYENLELEGMFLYKNQLSGTISSQIGNLWNLTHVHLSHNQISGSIPPKTASRSKIRQIRYFNVHRNQMTGSIPSNMRLRQMFYMDLGYNQFSGTIPSELGSEYIRLRHLYLDHNQFVGTVPQSVVVAGDGRISTLTVNDNQFEGNFPGDHSVFTQMLQMTIQNNNFDSMEKDSCKLDVFAGGEMVEFKSECDICQCGEESLMCRYCV